MAEEFPLHLHRSEDLFGVIYHGRSTRFARLPLDIRRSILAPMLLESYCIMAACGDEYVLGRGNERYFGGKLIMSGIDSFCAADFGYIATIDGDAYMVGAYGAFGKILYGVGRVLDTHAVTFGVRRGGVATIASYMAPWRHDDTPVSNIYRIDDVPIEYMTIVYYGSRYGYVRLVMWDGDRGLIGRAYDDTTYEDEWMPGTIVRQWSRRLPHVPVCFMGGDDTPCEAVYPWGEVEKIDIAFEYV